MPKGLQGFQRGHPSFLTEESRKKISAAHRGVIFSKERRLKISFALKGKSKSEKHRENMSKCRKGKKLSENTKKRMSIIRMGHLTTEETKEKISKAHKGKKLSEEHKRKISKTLIKISPKKEQRLNWKGGYENDLMLSRKRRILKKGNGGFHTLIEWQTLKAKYNWTCPACKKPEPEIKLTEDHIIPLSKGGLDNIENIQPLCKNCNCKKHNKIIKYDLPTSKPATSKAQSIYW